LKIKVLGSYKKTRCRDTVAVLNNEIRLAIEQGNNSYHAYFTQHPLHMDYIYDGNGKIIAEHHVLFFRLVKCYNWKFDIFRRILRRLG